MPNLKALAEQHLDEHLDHIEDHFHTRERWLGISADQSGNDWALEGTMNNFSVASQANDWTATAIKVLGTDDTPIISGMTVFDLHRIDIGSATDNQDYLLRFIYGSGTAVAAEAAGQYSDISFSAPVAAGPGAGGVTLDIRMPQLAAGTKVWAKLKASDVETITFHVGVHEDAS